MSHGWAFIPCDDETGDEVACCDCGRTIAPTEPLFRRHFYYWSYLCTDCACVWLMETP